MIRLNNTGAFYTSDYGKDEKEIEISSFTPYLQSHIEIEPGTLFESIWKFIVADQFFYNKLFAHALGHHDLQLWVDESLKSGEIPDLTTKYGMKKLLLSYSVEFQKYKDETDGYIVDDFGGVGLQEGWEDQPDFEGGYAIEFTPIQDLLKYPIEINPIIVAQHINLDNRKLNLKQLSGKFTPTVYDVIHSILFEITYCGKPQSRDDKKLELNNTIKGIEDGTIKTHPMNLEDFK